MPLPKKLVNTIMNFYSKRGVGTFFSISFEREQEGKFYFSVEFPEQSLNPSGKIQGGMITSVLDDCTALSVIMTCEGRKFPNTIDFHTTFHRPLDLEPVKVESQIIKLGKNVVSIEGKMFKRDNSLVASCLHTGILFDTYGLKPQKI